MAGQIEILDTKMKKYRGGLILCMAIFAVAWIMRSIIKIAGLEMVVVETILMVVLILSVLSQAYFALRTNLLGKQIHQDPFLKAALNDELVRYNELKAWRVSFFALIGYIVLVAILSLFVDYNDLMQIFITALLVGFGSYHLAVYLYNR